MTDPKDFERTAEIRFKVGLNHQQVPVAIEWTATDAPGQAPRETKSIMLSVWNAEEKKAMRISGSRWLHLRGDGLSQPSQPGATDSQFGARYPAFE